MAIRYKIDVLAELKKKGKGRQTMHLFVDPAGSHRARINTLPDEMRKEAIAILESWLEIEE